MYVWPQRVWFFSRFGLIKGMFSLWFSAYHWIFCVQETTFSTSTLAHVQTLSNVNESGSHFWLAADIILLEPCNKRHVEYQFFLLSSEMGIENCSFWFEIE